MEVTPYIAMGNFMVIGVEPGDHVIELSFVPLGLEEGIKISAIAAVLFILSYIAILFGKKKYHGEKEN